LSIDFKDATLRTYESAAFVLVGKEGTTPAFITGRLRQLLLLSLFLVLFSFCGFRL
jgi:hypothetical protein